MTRVLSNCRILQKGPPFKKKRARGLYAQGLSYERKVIKEIKGLAKTHVWHGPWFSYEDEHGKRKYCQPDALVLQDGTLYIVECKRTCLISAYEKLEQLYLPVVKGAFNDSCPIKCVQVFKYLTKSTLLSHPHIALASLFTKENPALFGVHLLL